MNCDRKLIAGNIFNGDKVNFSPGWILTEGTRIAEVREGTAPEGIDAQIINAEGRYVVPGLIDGHNHLYLDPGSFEEMSGGTEEELLSRMERNARTHLLHGVTAMREAGTPHFLDVQLKRRLEKGELSGPVLQVCGEWLTAPGGHGAFPGCAQIVRGETQIREGVRRVIAGGGEFVKVMVTGGNATAWSEPGQVFFTQEELNILTEEAACGGRQVAAHVHSSAGVLASVQAGISMIEHGSLVTDDETIERIREKGVVWTFNQHQRMAEPDEKMPEYKRRRTLEGRAASVIAVKKAIRAGVCMCAGCDGYHDNYAMVWALEGMVQSGAGHGQALLMGTKNPGQAFFGGSRGVLKTGAFADLLVVDEDPTANISALRKQSLVMQNGTVVRRTDR